MEQQLPYPTCLDIVERTSEGLAWLKSHIEAERDLDKQLLATQALAALALDSVRNSLGADAEGEAAPRLLEALKRYLRFRRSVEKTQKGERQAQPSVLTLLR